MISILMEKFTLVSHDYKSKLNLKLLETIFKSVKENIPMDLAKYLARTS